MSLPPRLDGLPRLGPRRQQLSLAISRQPNVAPAVERIPRQRVAYRVRDRPKREPPGDSLHAVRLREAVRPVASAENPEADLLGILRAAL